MPNDHFDISVVEQAIAHTSFAGHITHLSSVPSTNNLALQAAHSGQRLGVWIADEQTAGRGRGKHIWHSVPGDGLYMTALISPSIPMLSTLGLSFTTAIAVQSAVASVTGFQIRDQIDIRWPNDLLLNGRKCCGILIETSAQPVPVCSPSPSLLRHAVIGIGINVNHTAFPAELDAIATSLRRELPIPSKPLRREPLAAAILVALDDKLRALATNNQQPTTSNLSDFTQFSSWICGKRVRVDTCDDGSSGYTGVTAGLGPHGFLRVNGDDGQLHTVLAGGLREP